MWNGLAIYLKSYDEYVWILQLLHNTSPHLLCPSFLEDTYNKKFLTSV